MAKVAPSLSPVGSGGGAWLSSLPSLFVSSPPQDWSAGSGQPAVS